MGKPYFMNLLKILNSKFLQPTPTDAIATDSHSLLNRGKSPFKKIRGGFLVLLGWALSPLCWWNDLIFNLPIAYGFGYLCHWVSPNLFVPGAIGGYWLSNVVGILLMQAGFLDVVQGQTGERNLKKELLTGIATSTLYTAAIVLLLHFKVLETPFFALSF